jgi:hypothetical protein
VIQVHEESFFFGFTSSRLMTHDSPLHQLLQEEPHGDFSIGNTGYSGFAIVSPCLWWFRS